MSVKFFSDLQLAFEFVSSGGMGENEAYLDRQSGKIYGIPSSATTTSRIATASASLALEWLMNRRATVYSATKVRALLVSRYTIDAGWLLRNHVPLEMRSAPELKFFRPPGKGSPIPRLVGDADQEIGTDRNSDYPDFAAAASYYRVVRFA
jgi:hypothetical protein